jgi:hypothetical protein
MILSSRLLGQHTAALILERAKMPLLRIGRDTFFRRDLAKLECFNFTAAANLDKILKELSVRNTKDLFDNMPPRALILPRLGAVSLAVLGAAFEAKGIGGNAPLEEWYARHRPGDARREFVTFHSMKSAARRHDEGERKADRADRARKHARRDQAQRLRGDRFIERAAENGAT